jgi:excisionase family DNA binding protein
LSLSRERRHRATLGVMKKPPQNPPRNYESIRSAARRLACSEETISRYIRAGKLSSLRLGKLVRIPTESIDALLRPVEPKSSR